MVGSSTPRTEPLNGPAASRLDDVVAVLDLIRSEQGVTRPEIARRSGLGRTVVAQRVAQLITAGLVTEAELGASSGGRAPRQLRFAADAGVVLVAELGATGMSLGVSDLAGNVMAERGQAWDIARGPAATLECVSDLFDQLRREVPGAVWGIGLGLPGPVEYKSGRPVAPPIMPGWDDYPVRETLVERFDAPVWVDNEVNVMALAELRNGLAAGEDNIVYIKVGTGIGAGLVSHRRLHRGAQGCAGDIGHVVPSEADGVDVVCRCGNVGCLEARAGGAALARDATDAARDGRSPLLAERYAAAGVLTAADVLGAAEFGDPVSVELLQRAGTLIGDTVAAIVNFFNPSTILLGGSVGASGDLLLATIREAVYRRALPLATRELRIIRSPRHERAGLRGAAFMVVDELLSREGMKSWIEAGHPSADTASATCVDVQAQAAVGGKRT